MDLDEMLATANPPTIERGQALLDDLDELVGEARAARRRKRRVARWSIVGVAAAAIFGTGTAAVATGHLPFHWTSEQGGRCVITSATVEIGVLADDNLAAFASTTAKERLDTVQEARRYLAGYDYRAIDVNAAITTWQRAEAVAIAHQPDPSERAPRLEGDLLENRALIYRVGLDLQAHLKERGFNPDVLTSGLETNGQVGTDGVFRCDG
jgi:hypothetical protein